jgi:hypothetical protein
VGGGWCGEVYAARRQQEKQQQENGGGWNGHGDEVQQRLHSRERSEEQGGWREAMWRGAAACMWRKEEDGGIGGQSGQDSQEGVAQRHAHTARRQQELQGGGGSRDGRCHDVQQHLRSMKAIRGAGREAGKRVWHGAARREQGRGGGKARVQGAAACACKEVGE